MTTTVSSAILAVLGLSLFGFPSCTRRSDRPVLHPVTGSVFINGKPAADALVTFHPDGGDWKAQRSYGTAKADGTFRVGTYNPEDGVPEGKYRLTVIWAAPPPPGGDPQGDRLRGCYSNPKQPVATVTIKPGDNALEPIRLK